MRAAWLALLLIVPAFVGCVGDTGDALDEQSTDDARNASDTLSPQAPDRSFVGALDADHAHHQVPQLHTNGHGLTQVGYTSFEGFYPADYQGGWGEIDVHGDLAVVTGVDGKIGATLVDISDPENPEPLSFVSSTGADFDARITDGGDYLVLGCQVGAIFGGMRFVAGDCNGSTDPHAPETEASNAIGVWNISDPENPEPIAAFPTEAAHNVWTATIDGEIYFFTNEVEIIHFQPGAPEGERLEKVAALQGTHDVYVDEHPITGDWLLYTGSPEDRTSMAIYEINDPSSPSPLIQQTEGVVGWHEQFASPTVIDGRVIAVGGGETQTSTGEAGGAPQQKLTIVDVTDPENPEKLSEWKLPLDFRPPYQNYRFSAHNVHMTPYGQVVSAWYHGGLWVFDVSTQERQEDPVTLGFYQPHETPSPALPHTVPVVDYFTVPNVWGPQWTDDGRIVTGDLYTGLYVLEPSWGLYPTATAN